MGRRMHETMSGWGTDPSWADGSPEEAPFARRWIRMGAVVFSRTLEEVVHNGIGQSSDDTDGT